MYFLSNKYNILYQSHEISIFIFIYKMICLVRYLLCFSAFSVIALY